MAVEYRNVPELAEPPGYTHVATGHGSLVFTAGAVPIDETGELVGENDVVLQAERVIANLLKQLEEGGAGPQDVVKTTVYVASGNRSDLVTVCDQLVEVEAVAVRDRSREPDPAPDASTVAP